MKRKYVTRQHNRAIGNVRYDQIGYPDSLRNSVRIDTAAKALLDDHMCECRPTEWWPCIGKLPLVRSRFSRMEFHTLRQA